MLPQILFVIAAISVVFAFTTLGVFFLCFVWVHQRDHSRTHRALTVAEHMALDLHHKAMKLDEMRMLMFWDWLHRHCQGVHEKRAYPNDRQMQMDLKRWLETFEPDNLHDEYKLLASEIAWWQEADEKTLLRCLSKEFIERCSLR